MTRILSLAAALALVLSLAAPAGAADEKKKKKKDAKKGPDTAALFTKLDKNTDQKLSKDEFGAFQGLKAPKKEGKEPKGVASVRDEWFKRLDADKNGSLTAEEFTKVKDAVAAKPPVKKKKKAK
jgi:hypothetical protein